MSAKGGYAAASPTGSDPSAKYFAHSAAGFSSPNNTVGNMPSTMVRCPRTQSGWHPPFGVGNVVGTSLISSIALSTAPFDKVSANLIASFVCIAFSFMVDLIIHAVNRNHDDCKRRAGIVRDNRQRSAELITPEHGVFVIRRVDHHVRMPRADSGAEILM